MPVIVGAGDSGPVLIVALFLALAAVIAIVAAIQAAKRRQAWQALAEHLGCSFSRSDEFGIHYSYPQALFKNGSSRKAYNVLHGEVERREMLCFDYRYTTGSGKNRHTHNHTCLLLTPPVRFEPLSIRPESFLDRVGEFFGLDDIDFESEEFSRHFFVKCADKKFAYDIIHARTMELLVECGDVHLDAQAQSVLFYYTKTLSVPGEVLPMIRRGLKFLELIPHYLIEQARGAR